ncbi:MAG: hypothetical protein IV094_02145 [Vitreoscilla sp.]|nr:hypothetical protein [Vitreoscilla sp.]
MMTKPATGPSWNTSSFGDATDTSPLELNELGDHLSHCRGLHGRLFALQCGAEAVRSFVAARLVTSTFVVVTLAGAVLWWV